MRLGLPYRWSVFVAAAWVAAACSQPSRANRPAQSVVTTAAAASYSEPVRERESQSAAAEVFLPSVSSAQVYGGPAKQPLSTDPLARQLRQALAHRAREAGFPPPAFDGRMDMAATELASWQGPLGHELVNFVCHHVGLAEPQPGVTSLRANQADKELVGYVLQHTESALAHNAWARLGVGVSRANGEVGVVILLGSTAIDLAPLPRSLRGGAAAPINGRVPPGFSQPQVVVTTPRGRIGRLPVKVNATGFGSKFDCFDGRGRYDVEVLASGPRGPEVMVNVPVYCDESPPGQFAVAEASAFGDTSTASGVEQGMLAAINRERQKRGVAAVVSDPKLVQLARAHSRDMANQRTISHLSSRGEDAQVRVLAAGLSPRVVAENVGTATTAPAVHEGFMGSPGHRSNVIDPRVTHVGVGAVSGQAPNGLSVWYVTELFAGFPPKR